MKSGLSSSSPHSLEQPMLNLTTFVENSRSPNITPSVHCLILFCSPPSTNSDQDTDFLPFWDRPVLGISSCFLFPMSPKTTTPRIAVVNRAAKINRNKGEMTLHPIPSWMTIRIMARSPTRGPLYLTNIAPWSKISSMAREDNGVSLQQFENDMQATAEKFSNTGQAGDQPIHYVRRQPILGYIRRGYYQNDQRFKASSDPQRYLNEIEVWKNVFFYHSPSRGTGILQRAK